MSTKKSAKEQAKAAEAKQQITMREALLGVA